MPLQYDLATASNDGAKSTEGFDGKGDTLSAEMLPEQITFNDVKFQLAPAQDGHAERDCGKGADHRSAGWITTIASIFWRPRPMAIRRPHSRLAARK